MHCPKCGAKNPKDKNFCSECGCHLETGVVVIKEVAMDSYLFMESVLHLITQGSFFRKAFARVLQALAVVVSIAGLGTWMSVWRFAARAPIVAFLGIVIFQVLFVVALYMVAHALFIRARDIAALPDEEFYVIPIAAIALKLIGEVYASFVAVMSVAGGVLIWLMRGYALSLVKMAAPFVPRLGKGEGFVGGLLFMGGGLFAAFVVLVVSYFLAEAICMMADCARNIKITRQIAEQHDKSTKKS
jgi:predicted nucleic acid-binding Zn ribbon protein